MSISITIDLARIRANVEAIRRAAGVAVYAVVKSDAYGFGAAAVVESISDLVDAFCVFSLREARELKTGPPTLCIGPPEDVDPGEYTAINARPAVSDPAQAARFAAARPALCVDTGMQRFACPPEWVGEALLAGECPDAFTHAIRPEQAAALVAFTGGRSSRLKLHAAGSSLMLDPGCRLDAVRPGLAIYRGAARISAPFAEVRDTRGPAGYTGFSARRHGVIVAGYAQGLRPGPCRVNGRNSRLLEVGMQSSYVECAAGDRVGDEVFLLGDGLEADTISTAWKCSPQQVLVGLMNQRRKRTED